MINIDRNRLPLIEKALKIKLNENQINYLLGEEYDFSERRSGKTTVFCIKIALNTDITIRMSDLNLGNIRDRIGRDPSYNRFFKNEFLTIRQKLQYVGLDVCKISS